MSGALPFLVVGPLLVLLLILVVVRANGAGPVRFESFEDDRYTPLSPTEPLRQRLTIRLFGPQDQEFMAKQRCARLQRLFFQQRTDLALAWLRGIRANTARLMRIHNRAAGKNSGLEPLLELRILAEYLAIHAICQVLALVICVRGPINLSRMVAYADDLSNQFHEGIKQHFPTELAAENGNGQVHLKSGSTGS